MRIVTLLLFSASLLFGCSTDESATIDAPAITFDTVTCLGDIRDAAATDCRAGLARGLPEMADVCLVTRNSNGDAVKAFHLNWRDRGLVVNGDIDLVLDPGVSLEASLFLLTSNRGPNVCQPYRLDTPCTVQSECVLRLGPVSQTLSAQTESVIDFTRANECVRERPDTLPAALEERCDNQDNDCDGLTDETFPEVVASEPCARGLGLCRAEGVYACHQGESICNATPGASSVEECDGLDNDCDGSSDEDPDGTLRCDSCVADGDCIENPLEPYCVDEACRACRPIDNAGCSGAQPLCNSESYQCGQCQTGQCPDGLVCSAELGCVGCVPGDARNCPAATPVCDSGTLNCRGCEGNADCPAGVCENPDACPDLCYSDGVGADVDGDGQRDNFCVICNPETNIGCALESPTPVCDLSTYSCTTCIDSADCRRGDITERPACHEGLCAPCNPENNDGCRSVNNPICGELGASVACRPCLADQECGDLSCENGRCVNCTPNIANSGCAGNTPVCDANRVCRECREDLECQFGQDDPRLCLGGRCVECNPNTHATCPEDGAEPICRGEACDACNIDQECRLRPGDRNECAGGRCEFCDPVDNAGCGDGAEICDRNTLTCRGCENIGDPNGECRGETQYCVDEVCEACNPSDYAGCEEDAPVCDGNSKTCRVCNDDPDCDPPGRNTDSPFCVGGACERCNPADQDGCGVNLPICDPQTRSCRECEDNRECIRRPGSGNFCAPSGVCVECDPANGDGCDEANAPYCDPGTLSCRACARDSECALEPAARRICHERAGECVSCDPDDNSTGCSDAAEAYCEPNTRTCRGCSRDDECDGQPVTSRICIEEQALCAACDPNDNSGCEDPAAAICDADTLTCRGCIDDDCPTGECIDGSCQRCEPGDVGNCPNDRPVCDPQTLRCVPCSVENPCIAGLCNNGSCVGCDPADADTCRSGMEYQVCGANRLCEPCTNNQQCSAIENGYRCVGQGDDRVCALCDPILQNGCPGGRCVETNGEYECRGCLDDRPTGDQDDGCPGQWPNCFEVEGVWACYQYPCSNNADCLQYNSYRHQFCDLATNECVGCQTQGGNIAEQDAACEALFGIEHPQGGPICENNKCRRCRVRTGPDPDGGCALPQGQCYRPRAAQPNVYACTVCREGANSDGCPGAQICMYGAGDLPDNDAAGHRCAECKIDGIPAGAPDCPPNEVCVDDPENFQYHCVPQ